jgi:prepilin-type N-terminal cleavage/methylation domain-containing protein
MTMVQARHIQHPAGGRRSTSAGGVSATRSSPNAIIGGDDPARAVAPAPCRVLPALPAALPRQRGFTLTEVLVVIGIIVLLLVLAVPAFNFITGTRSIDGAQNNLSALLGRARAEAIAQQRITGVMFYIDRRSGGPAMALVRQADGLPGDDGRITYLDLVADADPVLLPPGVGIQMLDNRTPGVARDQDRYIGFNTVHSGGTIPPPGTSYGGAILFNSRGNLADARYGYRTLASGGGLTALGEILFGRTSSSGGDADIVPFAPPAGPAEAAMLRSHIGFVLFESEPYFNQFGGAETALPDPQVTGGTYALDEQNEEQWLDQNAVPFLINRYNGTLIRGE